MRGQAMVGGMQMCVLGTCYTDAVHKIMECLHVRPNSDTIEMNQAALIYALLFNRAFLYAVNRKGPLSAARGCIWMIWSKCN
eukprot:scaffold80646_cov31-Attheya_sp.AAC.1